MSSDMHDADVKPAAACDCVGARAAFTGIFHPGPHRFDMAIQRGPVSSARFRILNLRWISRFFWVIADIQPAR